MARRSQCSSAGDNPLDPNYLPPHYREEYRLAVDALVEEDLEGYYQFLQKADVVDFLSLPEIQYIQESVQVPEQSDYPDQRFLELGEDGSSDTYWPILSDLDAPGLDLGWPQLHHFIGPTEVTTLVNPPEPDMPSIKDQARRLIKNAQQVIAIVMDMFTDVDILADILNAAMRNVAVYILLDKENVHHFVNMVSNCRVNLQSIQFLRVRTVSGITYHCRSGKSFKGQMMDRFLLTDCRAVLSGNYSFMWSFEKLHRCMAHLFLGQLVSTFDEEFRILFAQSQPLIIENVPGPMDDFSLAQKRQYPIERPSLYREQRKFLSLDTAHPDDWARHSYDEPTEVDWRMMPLKKQESLHGPADMYGRFPSQQSRMDPCFDQGPSRMQMMDNPAFKRHSYAEGIHGRYSYPFLQQGMPEPDSQGRQFHRGPQPYPGPEADYGGYEKFWNQDFQSADQCSEPCLPPDMEPPDNFDPVLKYLSSTRNVDIDQGPNRLPPPADLPFSSSHPKRLTLGQPYTYETSPTPSNPTDQKQFFQEPNTNRKDPMVKQGLRNWRISSYLSAYDNPGDEGLPLAPPNASDPFEEPSNPTQQTAPGIDLSTPKIPNVREFKVPAIPRASQMPSYAKTTAREQPRKLPDEPTAVAPETTTTPACSELSSTNEREKTDEAEQKEPKPATIQREESFRRKYNAAVQRSSRLRSSLIFSSLEQQHPSHDTKTAPGQEDGESDKNEAEQTKLPFVSQVLGQRRSSAKDPVEWSRYIRSATFDSSATGSSKPDDGSTKADDKDPLKDKNPQDLPGNPEVQESSKPQNIEQGNSSPSISRSKPSEVELPKTNQPVQPPTSLFTTPFVDMSDPDNRLMFFKELAAKRRAAKAEEAEKSKEMIKPTTELQTNTTVKKEKSEPGEKEADTSTSKGLSEKSATTEDVGKTVSTEACHSVSQPLDASDKTIKEDSEVKDDFNTSQSCKKEQTRLSADSRKIQLKNIQTATTLHISEEEEAPQSKPPEEPKLSNLAVKKSSSCHPPTPTSATPANVPSLAQGTDKSESPCLDSTSKESRSLPPTSGEVSPTFANASLDSIIQNPEPVKLETPLLSEQHSESEYSSSNPAVQSSSDHILPESGSPSRSAPVQTIFSNENSSSSLTSSILSPKTEPQRPQSTEKKISPSAPDPPKKPTSPLASNPSQKPTSPIASNPSQSAEKTISPSAPAACQKPASHSASEPSQSTEKKISPSAPEPSQKPTRPSVSNPSQSAEKTVRPSTLDLSQKSTSPSTPEPSQLVEETSQKSTARRISQTESTQTHLDSVSQVMSPKTGSSVHSTRVVSDVSPDTCAADTSSSQPITATDFGESGALEKYVSESENYSVPANGEECEVIESSKDVKPDGITSSPSSSSAGSCLPKESALESKSRSDDNKTISPTLSPVDCPPKHSPAEISIPVQPDLSPNASQLGTTASSPDVPVLTTTPSELNLSGSVTPAAAETVSRSSPLTETSGSVLFPEAEKTLSDLHSLPDTNSPLKQITAVSNKDSKLQSAETCSPNEPTSKFPTEPDLPCKTSQSVTSETHPSDPLVPAEGTNMDSPNNTSKEPEMPESDEKKKTDDTEATNKVNETTPQGSTCSEKTSDQVRQNNCSDLPEITSDGAIPPSQSKLPKSSQSRYHSSTANVLSSSNLRDDTKLLLEQISANSQSRSEASKESPVTDDEKEDEADKHAKRDTERETNESPATDDEKEDKADKKARGVKEGEIRSLGRVQPKSTGQERDKLLERIQSMRKERKVYSRFEV